MAHMQGRLGPMYAGGFHGWAQLVADGVKFVQKEDITPRAADRWVFRLAPAVALVPYLVALAAIPRRPGRGGHRRARLGRARARGHLGRRPGHPDGRLGQRQQVRPARRPARGGAAACPTSCRSCSPSRRWRWPAARCRCPASPTAGRRGGCCGSCPARSSSSSPPSPSCSGRRSTCRWPTPSSSSGAWTEYTGLRFAFFLLAEYAGIVVMSLLFAVALARRLARPVRGHAGLAVDPAQGFRRGRPRHLGARRLAPAARGPAAAARLARRSSRWPSSSWCYRRRVVVA